MTEAQTTLEDVVGYNQAILDVVADGIICIDDEGYITTFNKSAEEMFGYTADEIIGQKINLLMPHSHAARHDQYLKRYSNSGKAKLIGTRPELEGKRKNGDIFPIEVGLTEASHRGRRIFVSVVRDITERKRVERMKSEFISTVSHEIRTPLTSIYAPLSMIASGELGHVPPEVESSAEIAVRNCENLIGLVNDLLDFEKLSSGRMSLDQATHDVEDLLGEVVTCNEGYAMSCGVELEKARSAEGLAISVDEGRFRQVLSNLVSNALKFSDEGGSVTVASEVGQGQVTISVIDKGPGIPAEYHDRIFKRFSQVDGSDARGKGGSGLGLAISKELTEQMGGEVGFSSAVGQGSTFWVRFPLLSLPSVPQLEHATATSPEMDLSSVPKPHDELGKQVA